VFHVTLCAHYLVKVKNRQSQGKHSQMVNAPFSCPTQQLLLERSIFVSHVQNNCLVHQHTPSNQVIACQSLVSLMRSKCVCMTIILHAKSWLNLLHLPILLPKLLQTTAYVHSKLLSGRVCTYLR